MKRLKLSFIVLLLCLGGVLQAQGNCSISCEEGVFTYKDYTPFASRPVDVHYYIPSSGDVRTMPIVFVFEGADRGYSYLLKAWREQADKEQFMLFIPHFDPKDYPLSDYQETGVLNKSRTAVKEQPQQTSALVDKIFEYIQLHSGSQKKTYRMYGHSAGGQFVQRFMLFYDSPYVEKAIIGSPGWYTFPDSSQVFPYGIKNIPYVNREVIKRYLAKNIVLQLATGDTVRESYLRKTPEAETQGCNRYERGNKFYRYLQDIAAANHWPCYWSKTEVQGIGHQSIEMGKEAVPLMLGDSIRALFIGNSYTYYNQMVQMVKSIANSTGRKLSVKMVQHGGWTLQQHADSPETVDAIKQGGWDFVVFQEQSQAPSKDKAWVEKHVYPAAQTLDALRKQYNPKGKTVFYMTWGHQIETYEYMQQRLAESYLEMTTRQNGWCAPVGIAWKRILTEKPEMKLYDPDHSHPSLRGSYLAANVFCSVFFQKLYTSSYLAGLPEEEARYLQRTAQEVVLSNLTLWNIQPITQPQTVTHLFYPDSPRHYATPTLSKPVEEGLASLTEIFGYLKALANNHKDKVTLTSIGETPEGREIPVLYFTSEIKEKHPNKKIRVWMQGSLHGNEPAGTEAICMLAHYLLNHPEGQSILENAEIALVPVANADGYAVQNRKSGNGLDLNRDQSKLADPVSLLLKKAYSTWNPGVTLDLHEYTPARKEFNSLRGHISSIASDVLFLPSGHPNIPACLRNLSTGLFQQQAEKALTGKGYTSNFYFTPNLKAGTLYASKGAKSPQSSSTSQALTNAISLFIEIRGIGLGRTSFSRRAESGFIVAQSMLQTVCQHQQEIKSALRRAVKETLSCKKDVHVTFQSKETTYLISFIDFRQCKPFTQTLPTLDALQPQSILTRQRPEVYILADTCQTEVQKLRALGIEVQQMKQAQTIHIQKHIVTQYKKSHQAWEKIYPVKISTQLIAEQKTFPAGCFIVPLSQKNANLAASLLEPEAENGFVSFCVTTTDFGKELPIYRKSRKKAPFCLYLKEKHYFCPGIKTKALFSMNAFSFTYYFFFYFYFSQKVEREFVCVK